MKREIIGYEKYNGETLRVVIETNPQFPERGLEMNREHFEYYDKKLYDKTQKQNAVMKAWSIPRTYA